jgi:hypothetical protein
LTGAFGTAHQLLLTAAIVLTYFIGTLLPTGSAPELQQSMSWRVAMGVPGMFAIVQVLLLLIVYRSESPFFYFTNKNSAMVPLPATLQMTQTIAAIYTKEEDRQEAADELEAKGRSSTVSAIPKVDERVYKG